MSGDKLTALQRRILRTLAAHDLGWVLTGGGALAGVHLHHRTTRDLDLFWHGREHLQQLPREVQALLRAEGLVVETVQSALTFCRLRVSDGAQECVVDLVADPSDAIDSPIEFAIADRKVLVDTPREILANKLCTLLSRSEVRDLVDVRSLLAAGADFEAALRDAARKDGGFSPLTLAWVLQGFDARAAAAALGWAESDVEDIATFKQTLTERLVAAAAPE